MLLISCLRVVAIRRALAVSGRENCNFFTMMRHPIDRLISQFFYCPRDHDIQGRPPKVHTTHFEAIYCNSCPFQDVRLLPLSGLEREKLSKVHAMT